MEKPKFGQEPNSPAALSGVIEPLAMELHTTFYNSGVRSVRDNRWRGMYVVTSIVALVWGIVCVAKANPRFSLSMNLSSPQSCPAVRGRHLLVDDAVLAADDVHAIAWIFGTLVFSLVVGLLYIQLFKKHAKGMVIAAAALHVACLAIFGLALLALSPIPGVILLALAVGLAIFYRVTRERLFLCARLFNISTYGLVHNPGIFGLFTSTLLVWEVVFLVGAFFIFQAVGNGTVVVNPQLAGPLPGIMAEGAVVLDDVCQLNGVPIDCCTWQLKGYATGYIVFMVFFLIWSAGIVQQFIRFVIAGVISQWYYLPMGLKLAPGTIMRSVRHGLGPQFGTLALGGLILALVSLLRSLASQARRQVARGRNIVAAVVCCLLSYLAEFLLSFVEFLTHFATIWASIKGDSFLDSGRKVSEVLARNLLESIRVWWFPPVVLTMTSLAVALLWSLLVFGLVCLDGTTKGDMRWLVPLFAFITSWLVMQLFGTILLHIVDVVYLCYAFDKDLNQVTQRDVHQVFEELPVHKLGTLVEQPDGLLAVAPLDPPQPPRMTASQEDAASSSETQPLFAKGTSALV